MNLLANLIAAALTLVANATAGGDVTLRIEVDGLRSDAGEVFVAVYGSAEGFPGEVGRAVRSDRVRPVDRRAACVFHVPPGTYAVSVLHDENGNGRLDTGFFGIPREGLGASNDAQGRFGPPRFEDAKLAVPADRTTVIHVRYFP
jgi:uncharacterized protein (DUF2141 family)